MSAISVTVLINNYNYGRYLQQAIDSVLEQHYRDLEILIVDDGSTDNSREVIANYGGKIRSVLKPNGGQASAFNAGFAASRGDLICLLDSDDWFLSGKVRRVAEMFATTAEAGWLFHPLQTNFADGSVIREPETSTRFIDERESAVRRGRLTVHAPATSGLCFARKLLHRLLPMPEEIRITSDNYLKFGAMSLAPGVYLDEALAAQRIHPNNAYTLRGDRLPTQARMHLLIAQGLKSRYPELRRLSDKVFAKALADYIATRKRDPDCRAVISRYFEEGGLARGINILGHAGYHFARRHFSPRAKGILRKKRCP
jgi:glycosyltransferase involved in cell wall biosynthesis